jgi:hypothetical protein
LKIHPESLRVRVAPDVGYIGEADLASLGKRVSTLVPRIGPPPGWGFRRPIREVLMPRMSRIIALAALAIAVAAPALAADPVDAAIALGPRHAGIEFNVIESDPNHTLIEVLLPEITVERVTVDGRELGVLRVPGGHPYGDVGQPRLAVDGTLIAIPPTSGVDLRIVDASYRTLSAPPLVPVRAADAEPGEPLYFDEAAYASSSLFPLETVTAGEPAIMRDFRVVPLRVYPVRYDAAAGEITVTTRLIVELDYSRPGRINLLTTSRPASPAFRATYERKIANYEFVRPRYMEDDAGKYLIITHDSFYDIILPLAEWKHQRGMEVEVAKLSVIGSSTSAIKSYIQSAYNGWIVPPEYILLVGDTEYLPTYSSSDDYYAKLAGSDYLVDVHLGRFSADSVADCELLLSKTMGYGKTPFMSDLDWFRSGTLIVRQDYDEDDDIYFGDTWHAYNLMEASNFAQIDTFFSRNGTDRDDVHAAVTDGRSLLMYRGQGVSNWWSPYDCNPNSTNPGFKLPVVIAGTCGSGAFYSDGYPCETWMRAGTAGAPKGSVGFLATSRVASHVAHLRSAVARGIWSALFNERKYTIGAALDEGKYDLYVLYGDQGEYAGWNCQGDPELDVWTAVPRDLDVSHSVAVPPSTSDLLVTVEYDGSAVDGALVCAFAEDYVYETAQTGYQGTATLTITPDLADTVWITVSGHNMHPHVSHVVVTPTGPFLTYAGHTVDDSVTGNNDGLVSPGETVALQVELANVGPDPATDVDGVLRTGDAYAAVAESTATYGTIPSGGSATNPGGFTFAVGSDAPNGHGLSFNVYAYEVTRGDWTVNVPAITVSAGDVEHVTTVIDDAGPGGDGDASLEAGETAWLTLTVENAGPIALTDVAGTLSASDPQLVVSDPSGYFGDIAAGGGTATSSGNSFRVSASPIAQPGTVVTFTLTVTGDGGTYTHTEDVEFTVTIGGTVSAGPSGPCAYGYYAYDAGDTWTGQAPVYDWVELVGTGSLISAITNADAATTTLSLPFTFRYYGMDYTTISVCSNGFLAMGTEDYRFGDNSQIPDTHGPEAMIAPMWDDLDPSTAGDIYQWFDSSNHRWIVQFDAVAHYGGGNPETFEVILYDPAFYPTGTGDGIVVFQYQDVRVIGSCTVGIENQTETTGIQYLYNSNYDPAAAPIANGSAIKFTTDPPEPPPVWLAVDGMAVDDDHGGNGDGFAQPNETVDLIVTLRNHGSSTATGASATITSTDPDVVIDDGSSTFGDVGPGATADNAGSPFTVTIGDDPSDDTIEFEIHVTSGGARYDTWDVLTLELDLTGTGVDDGVLDLAFALRQNAPNPFRDGTSIAFQLPQQENARIEVFDVAGRRVATVIDRELPAGLHTAVWDGRDTAGNEVSAGIYFCRLAAGQNEGLRKMILLK